MMMPIPGSLTPFCLYHVYQPPTVIGWPYCWHTGYLSYFDAYIKEYCTLTMLTWLMSLILIMDCMTQLPIGFGPTSCTYNILAFNMFNMQLDHPICSRWYQLVQPQYTHDIVWMCKTFTGLILIIHCSFCLCNTIRELYTYLYRIRIQLYFV